MEVRGPRIEAGTRTRPLSDQQDQAVEGGCLERAAREAFNEAVPQDPQAEQDVGCDRQED